MAKAWFLMAAAAAWLPAVPARLLAQQLKPETVQGFECYVRTAEDRMAARKVFLTADADPGMMHTLLSSPNVQTVPGNGENPHKIAGAMIYDWIGTIFIPGASVARTVRMLQDYDHRAQYFPEIISTSKLLCRSGENRFGFSMRLKEPAVIDSENDVVWQRVDARTWRCRSYSTAVREIGKQHGYLLQLNSYWRFAETDRGVFVEGQTITLSGEFGSLMRTLGSLAGINPEKSLRRTLISMRTTLQKPGLEFFTAPAGPPGCGEPVRAPGCALEARQ